MKIERINENQVKIMLTRLDLDERNIKLGELAYGSEKAQELFRDIMEEAHMQCGFESENFPLMIEAIPYSQDSITIIVTKVQNPNDLEERFKQLQRKLHQDVSADGSDQKDQHRGARFEREASATAAPVFVFSFDTLDEAATAAARLNRLFIDESRFFDALFKHNSLFYLFIELQDGNPELISKINPIVSEHGRQHCASAYSKYYLMEHGTVLIPDSALEKLAVYIGE
ncbi:MAG: adaptor protein MecA [Defluviitaleaceae bacterium]|nr:adaptor protein MecA [Defluviitaleaceae bacterium]